MTKMLDEAIEKIRDLPDATQDEAAEILLALAARADQPATLDDEIGAAIREGREQARLGAFSGSRASSPEDPLYFANTRRRPWKGE